MCTVTFIPLGQGSFALSSNRDEAPARSPQNLTRVDGENRALLFPRDTAAGGSWIAASSDNRVVCVLNGAFEKHSHRPPYKKSRGVMALEFFEHPRAELFAKEYDFEGMEPFTMVIADNDELFELRWDESSAHFTQLDENAFHLWSSATLYTAPVREKRQTWFRKWLDRRTDFSLEAIHQLHRTGGDGDPWNDYVMNREGRVQTVSISHILKRPDSLNFYYHDLLRQALKTASLLLPEQNPPAHHRE